MNEQEIELGERFLIDRVAFFLGKNGNWSPRADVEHFDSAYAVLRLEEYALHLLRRPVDNFDELPPVLALGQTTAIKATGKLREGLCYVLADEGAE